MLKRAYISVIKNKGRTIILALLLFVIANLVLSSISIKSATTEAMDQARISLGPEITLTTNTTELFDYIREYRDTYGTKPDTETINEMLVPITSDVAYGLANSNYVDDYNFVYSTNSTAVDFNPIATDGTTDQLNLSKISITGTYNPLLLDEFGDNGTFELTTESSSFTGLDKGVIIISETLAYANSLIIGDIISLETFDFGSMSFEIVGVFNAEDIIESSGKANSDNQVFISLDDALVLKGQDPTETFTITTAKYYLDDPLNIDIFIEESINNYPLIADGSLMFNDVNYDAVTAPLENVSTFSNIILIVSVIASVIILTLLIVNTLKERKYEIGVLLSLGEDKYKISLQYLIELLLVAVIAFSFAMVSSNSVSGYLGDVLLDNEITDASSEPTTQTGGGKGSFATVPLGDIEYIDEIDVSVSITDFLITLVIGSSIIILSSVIPSLYITRFQPKKILSSRN